MTRMGTGTPIDDVVWERLLSAHPGVTISRPEFERHAARSEATEATVSDLFLCCACAAGDPKAIAMLDASHLTELRSAMANSAARYHDPADLLQALREKLLVAGSDQIPKIAEYTGRAPLRAWLRVVAIRLATSASRKRTETPTTDSLERMPTEERGADPELAYLREKFQGVFEAAFRAASQALAPEERNALRYHFVDGLSIDQIGAIYGLHRVSASRRVQKAREHLIERTKAELRKAHFASDSEMVSVLGAVESQVLLSVRTLFQ